MKKKSIILSLILGVSLVFSNVSVHASEKPEDNISKMQQKFVKPGANKVGSSETYIRIDPNSNGPEKIKQFNEEEYGRELIKSIANPIKTFGDVIHNEYDKYQWIKLSLQAYDYEDDTYSYYGFYEWKTKPVLSMGKEILSLTASSGVSFDYPKSVAQVNNPSDYGNGYQVTTLTSTSSDFKQDTHGVAFSVPAPTSNLKGYKPFGMIQTKIVKASSTALNCNLIFTYSHRQSPLFVEPSITLGPTGISLGLSEFAFDPAVTGAMLDLR